MLDTKCHPLRAGLLLGLIHGVLFGMAFPPFGMWFLAPFAPLPLIFAAVRTDRAARAALGAGLGTAPMWAFHHQYTWEMTEAAFVPLALYLAVYPGLFVWMMARVHRRWAGLPLWLAAPVLWTGLEVLRGEVVWDGYAQYLIGHPMIDRMIAHLATGVGAYGAGFVLVCAVAALTPRDIRRDHSAASSDRRTVEPQPQPNTRSTRPPLAHRGFRLLLRGLAGLVVFCSIVPWTELSLPSPADNGYLVASIQTNVPQDNRTSQTIDERLIQFREFCDLTRRAAEREPKPSLIVWPEAMFPGYALNPGAVEIERAAGLAYPGNIQTTAFYDTLIELQKEIDIPMLVGGQAVEALKIEPTPDGRVNITQDALYNSAFMIRGGVVEANRYDKMQLMPFGEVMPYISNWDWLEKQLLALGGRGLTFDLEAGTKKTIFEVESPAASPPPLRIATPICFESTYTRHMRRLVQNDGVRQADLFVNMSNDGWFAWFDGGRENVLLQSRWRALELGTPMLRAVNTGISAAIDAEGRLISSLRPRESGVLVAEFDVQPREMTIYARFGNVVGWTCFVGMVLLCASTIRNGREAASPAAADSKDSTS